MPFIVKNPLCAPTISKTPPSPPDGMCGIFPKEDGWYSINSDGTITALENTSNKIQNIFDAANTEQYPSAGAVMEYVVEYCRTLPHELTANKTLQIDENSTELQYPSATAVKLYVDTAIGTALEGDY